jgi:CRISPR-associated protein Csx10
MITRTLELTLLSDAIFTASSATIGRPASLDRLPGATLLGAAASRCYPELDSLDLAVGVFHLGELCFGDGLPVHPDLGAALPVPLSWHELKYGEGVLDLSQLDRPRDQQLSQLRGGLVVPDRGCWRRWDLGRRASMRTAIDERGQAREGLLYGFEAVPAGTRYRVALRSKSERALDIVTKALCRGSIRVGRSRSAEFGHAEVRALEEEVPGAALANHPAQPGFLRFLCVSDLALLDPMTGSPRLVPCAVDLGLPEGWRLDLERSFLRFRRYSPFNGYRRRPDMERQVIEAGSVITFSKDGALNVALTALRERLVAGVGEHRSSGLGVVLLEPELLAEPHPTLARVDEIASASSVAPPKDPLVAWLQVQSDRERLLDATWAEAEAQAEDAARWNVPRSQWGRLRGLAAEARHRGRSKAELRGELEDQIERGVAGDTWARGRGRKLLAWFDGLDDSVDPIRALELLGRRVPRHMAAREEKHHA